MNGTQDRPVTENAMREEMRDAFERNLAPITERMDRFEAEVRGYIQQSRIEYAAMKENLKFTQWMMGFVAAVNVLALSALIAAVMGHVLQ